MEHLTFLLWMLLFPLISEVSDYLTEMRYDKAKVIRTKEDVEGGAFANIFILLLYLGTGLLLY